MAGRRVLGRPEIDQGHGLADTHGVAGFPSAEAYKFGNDYPYARVQRYFVRQTIDLGGETQKVDPSGTMSAFRGVRSSRYFSRELGRP